MNKHAGAYVILPHTTGSGIVIGTNVDIGGIIIGSVAGTVTVLAGTTTILETTASVQFPQAIGLTGLVTATSSACSFSVIYHAR